KLTQAREGLMTEHAMGEAVDLLVELARRNGEGRIPIGDAIFSRARARDTYAVAARDGQSEDRTLRHCSDVGPPRPSSPTRGTPASVTSGCASNHSRNSSSPSRVVPRARMIMPSSVGHSGFITLMNPAP